MLRGWKYRGWDLRGASPLVGIARLKKVYHTQHTVSKGTMAVSVLVNWTGGRGIRGRHLERLKGPVPKKSKASYWLEPVTTQGNWETWCAWDKEKTDFYVCHIQEQSRVDSMCSKNAY